MHCTLHFPTCQFGLSSIEHGLLLLSVLELSPSDEMMCMCLEIPSIRYEA